MARLVCIFFRFVAEENRGSAASSRSGQRSSALHLIVRVSPSKDKSRESECSFGFYGPSGIIGFHIIGIKSYSGNRQSIFLICPTSYLTQVSKSIRFPALTNRQHVSESILRQQCQGWNKDQRASSPLVLDSYFPLEV